MTDQLKDFDPSRAQPVIGGKEFDPSRAQPVTQAAGPSIMDEAKRIGSDTGKSLLKGVISLPEAAVGIADIPTGGAVGKLAEQRGFTPKAWKDEISKSQSPELQEQQAKVQSAQGFVPTVQAALENPATIWHSAMESIPGTLAGAGIGRAAAARGLGAHAAAGLGEGVVTAGNQVEQIRQETPDGTLTPAQVALGAGSGAVTGLIGAGSAGVAKKLGIHDVDEMLVGGVKTPVTKGTIGRVGTGMLTEGALEELPQSAQEQIATNLATSKAWDEGVGNAAAMGALTGAGMGGGINIPGPLTKASAMAQAQEQQRQMPIKSQEAAQARANAMTTETGTPHEVVPHPTVGGAFAVQQQAPEGQDDGRGNGSTASQKAGVDAAVRDGDAGASGAGAAAGLGNAAGAEAVGQEPARPGAAAVGGQPAGAAGVEPDGRAGPVIGPLTDAATAAPSVPNGTVTEGNEVADPVAAEHYSNVGAGKYSFPLDLRMDSPFDEAAHTAANSPLNDRTLSTPAQQDANNAKLGHAEFQGLPIRIENPQGSERASRPDAPEQWRSLMTEHYGYIKGTKGMDGDPIDVFVGAKVDSPKAFVIDQTINGKADEHKVMLGFDSLEAARQAYYDNYQHGWQGGEAIHETTVDGLKAWLKEGDTLKPFGPAGTQAASTQDVGAPTPAAQPASSSTGGDAHIQTRADQVAGQQSGESASVAPLQAGPESVQSPSAAMPAAASSMPLGQQQTAPGQASTSANGEQATDRSSVDAGSGSLVAPDKVGAAKDTALTNVQDTSGANISQSTALDQGALPESKEATQAVSDKVMPAAPKIDMPSAFASEQEARQFNDTHGLSSIPVQHPHGEGFALVPKLTPNPLEQRHAEARVTSLNTALKDYGVAVQAVHQLTPEQSIVKRIAQRAFGSNITIVSGNPVFDGVAHDSKVFISENAKGGVLIHTAFHELKHVMQQTNRPLAARLEKFVMGYVNGGLVEQRAQFERDAAAAAGDTSKLDAQGERDEVMADINGALALDPKFWSEMAKHDESLFRKVAYKFMELLTKAVQVGQDSRYDIKSMVTDVGAVREAIAKGWAEYNATRDATNKGTKNEQRKLSRKTDGEGQASAEAGRVDGGVRGEAGVLAEPSGQDRRLVPLRNLPATVKVDGREVTFGPFAPAREAAAKYMEKAGLPYRRQTEYVKVDPERAKAIAAEFDAMKNDPSDPATRASYDAMIRETLAQYEAILDTGLKIEFIDYAKQGDPYGNPRNAILDVVNNNHLWVFSTRDGFGGPNAKLDVSSNPLLAETKFQISGQTALANDIFRVVHDYFGHIKEGIGFRAEGEENAWQQHVRMYSPQAIPAMTSETRGQNSWVNFGPYAEANRTANGADTEYAPQKIGLMPEWTHTAGRAQFARRVESVASVEHAFEIAQNKKFPNMREFKLAIQNEVQAAAKASKQDLRDPDYLARIIQKDAEYALKTNANAIGWYNDKVSKAIAVSALVHPEIATDPQARFAFVWALAVTSNGNKVDKNFELAERAFQHWKDTGSLPTDIGIGKAASMINNSMAVFNELDRQWGFEKLEQFMLSKMAVRDIEKASGFDITGEAKGTQVYGAAILGPKVGNGFFMNLYGHFDQLTMDRWLMRSWGRWTGNLIKMDPALIQKNAERVKAAVAAMDASEKRAFEKIIGTRVTGSPTTVSQAILDASEEPAKRQAMNALPNGAELRMAGNNMAKNLDGQIEAPRNSATRDEIRAAFSAALESLKKKNPSLTMADLQALLWYPEKRLYDSAASDAVLTGYDDTSAPDYANAAVKMAQNKGVSQDAINNALEKANGKTPADGRAGRARDRADAGAGAAEVAQLSRAGLAEPAGGPGVDSVRGVALREQQADALAPVRVTHYSTREGLNSLVAAYYGTGLKGAEAARLRDAPPEIKHRVYFYLSPETGLPRKESGLGNHVYTQTLSNLYDLSKDPAGIFPQIRSISDPAERNNAMELAIVHAGYDGYVAKAFNMAVVLGQNVPVKYEGKDYELRRAQLSRAPATEAFQKWFGDSKITNEDGTPKTMYHGTARDIEVFLPKQASAIFITDKPRFAEGFAMASKDWMASHAKEVMTPQQMEAAKAAGVAWVKANLKDDFGIKPSSETGKAVVAAIKAGTWEDYVVDGRFDEPRRMANVIMGDYILPNHVEAGETIMPLYVKAERPWDYQNADHRMAVGVEMAKSRNLEDHDKFARQFSEMVENGDWDQIERWDVQQAIKALGHDAFYMAEGGQRNLAVYSPHQLKSATGNNGEYDPNKAELHLARKPPAWIAQAGISEQLAEKVGAYVPGKTFKQRWQDMRAGLGEKLTQALFDQYAPIKALDLHSYMLARMSKSVDGAVEAMLDYGKVGIDGDGALTVDMTGGFKRVMAQLQGEQDRFFAWVAGNRSEALKAQGRENLFDDVDIAALKNLNQGRMQDGQSRAILYAKMNRELQAYNNSVLDVAEKTGIIDPAARQVWAQQYYVPFYRLSEDDETFTPLNVSGLANAKGIQKLKGGTNNLGDLMQNTVLNWNYLLSAALKNQAATLTLRNAELVGAAQQIGGPVKGSVFTLDQGRKVHWQVTDPALATAVGSISFTGIKGPVIDAASAMKRALSFGVTFSPSYRIRNLIRDQLQAIAVNPMSYNVAANLVNGLKYSSKDNPLYAQMLASGGLIRMGSAYEDNRARHLKSQIAKLDPATVLDTQAKVKQVLGRMFDAYMETGERAEAATRMAIGKKALEDGATNLEAAYLMRDSMDFSLQGSATAVRVLAQVVPFFNARMQGMYKLGRGAMEDKARFATVMGATVAATVALMMANAGDPDWDQREEWDRNNYWWFKVGGTAFRIPKPFEMGAFATIAERGVEMAMSGMNKVSRERFMKQTWNVLMDNLSMNPTPQIVKPAIEVFANRDTFRNRDIESLGDQRLSKNERSGPGTTALARLLAKGVNAVHDDTLSPKQIDYLIQGYFGWIGAHLAMASDYALRPAMGLPEKPTRKLDDTFVVGDWVKELPSSQSRYVTQFFDQAKQVQQAMSDINHYKKLGDRERVQDLIAQNRELLQNKTAYTEKSQVMARISLRLKQIDADTKMSADDKRQEINRLTTLRNQIAKTVVERTTK